MRAVDFADACQIFVPIFKALNLRLKKVSFLLELACALLLTPNDVNQLKVDLLRKGHLVCALYVLWVQQNWGLELAHDLPGVKASFHIFLPLGDLFGSVALG